MVLSNQIHQSPQAWSLQGFLVLARGSRRRPAPWTKSAQSTWILPRAAEADANVAFRGIEQCVAVALNEADVRTEGGHFFVLTAAHDGFNLTWVPSVSSREGQLRQADQVAWG